MTTLDLDALERAARARTYDWNGHVDMEMSYPDLTDIQVAGKVRMLMRDQLDHEAVCTMARDRIMALAKEKAALTEAHRDLQERVEGAEKALMPFANAPGLGGSWSDDEPLSGYWADVSNDHSKSNAVTFGQLRAARAYFAARTKAGVPHEQE